MHVNSSRYPCLTLVLLLVGCASFDPVPLTDVGFLDRLQTKSRGPLTVSVSVLSADEATAAFDANLYRKRIQPVFLRIENRGDEVLWFAPRSLDPDYVSPLEAAYRSHRLWAKEANLRRDYYFFDNQMRIELPPRSTTEGFVFATLDQGARLVVVEILGKIDVERFEFVVEIPGFNADYLKALMRDPYPEQETSNLGVDQFREWIGALHCCVTSANGKADGDPINLIVVGDPDAVWPAFLRSGWDPTESLTIGTAAKTAGHGIFGGKYRNAPVSPLYAFDRPQDIALQKARHNIHLRNHLRLWLAPVTFDEKQVWVGQISRDIGTRFTTKVWNLTTHKIDPDVDETRSSLLQDMIYTQSLEAFAFASGVGAANIDEPRRNLTGDPYFTDGLRLVMILTRTPTSLIDLEYLEWETPGSETIP